MIVHLPQNFQISAIGRFVSMIVGPNGAPLAQEITFDFSKLSFVDGSGYTVLSNAIQWLISEGVVVKFANFERPANMAIQYLDDCGLFQTYVQYSVRPGAQVRDTTLPCSYILHQDGFGWVEYRLSPWLQRTLFTTYESLGSIRTCVKEVLNNIADHSTVNTGFVHAQHYPNRHAVKITMSDFGEGIPGTIRATYGVMSDNDAIVFATQEGVTSKSRPNNMGAGLSYLVDTMVANRGIARFHSLGGNVTCTCDNRGQKTFSLRRGTGLYPGTLVELELDTRLFVGDEVDRTDFEWQ